MTGTGVNRDDVAAGLVAAVAVVLVGVGCWWGLGLGPTGDMPAWAVVALSLVVAATWAAVPALQCWDARRQARWDAERAARRAQARSRHWELAGPVWVQAQRLDRPALPVRDDERGGWAA